MQTKLATPTPELSQPIYRGEEVADRARLSIRYGDALNPTRIDPSQVN